MPPSRMPSTSAYTGARTPAQVGLKLMAMARTNATSPAPRATGSTEGTRVDKTQVAAPVTTASISRKAVFQMAPLMVMTPPAPRAAAKGSLRKTGMEVCMTPSDYHSHPERQAEIQPPPPGGTSAASPQSSPPRMDERRESPIPPHFWISASATAPASHPSRSVRRTDAHGPRRTCVHSPAPRWGAVASCSWIPSPSRRPRR